MWKQFIATVIIICHQHCIESYQWRKVPSIISFVGPCHDGKFAIQYGEQFPVLAGRIAMLNNSAGLHHQ